MGVSNKSNFSLALPQGRDPTLGLPGDWASDISSRWYRSSFRSAMRILRASRSVR